MDYGEVVGTIFGIVILGAIFIGIPLMTAVQAIYYCYYASVPWPIYLAPCLCYTTYMQCGSVVISLIWPCTTNQTAIFYCTSESYWLTNTSTATEPCSDNTCLRHTQVVAAICSPFAFFFLCFLVYACYAWYTNRHHAPIHSNLVVTMKEKNESAVEEL